MNQLGAAAYQSLDSLQQAATTSLKYAIDKRAIVTVELDIAGPEVHVPQQLDNPESPELIIRLGNLSLQSNHSAREAVTKKTIAAGEGVDTEFFYDKYLCSIKDVAALLRVPREEGSVRSPFFPL
jgi:hypothetical protein